MRFIPADRMATTITIIVVVVAHSMCVAPCSLREGYVLHSQARIQHVSQQPHEINNRHA